MLILILDPKALPPTGFALFNLGFRPFFLVAALWAVLAMAFLGLTLALTLAHPSAALPFSASWHGHEMLFGYAVAVIAGFLLTAARNWTGGRTPQGVPLAAMLALWAAPRLLLPFAPPALLPVLAAADVGFDLLLAAVLIRTLWRNPANRLIFPPLLLVLALANLAWWLAMLGLWPAGHAMGLALGQGAVIGVLLVMGVRVAPFFIEKRLNVPVTSRVPARAYRTGAVLYALLVLAGLFGVSWFEAGLAAALGLLAAWVLWRWHAPGLWREPLLWILWLSGAWLVLGLLLVAIGQAAGHAGLAGAARHALLAGGLGLATIGMMARVTLGHTGRAVYPPARGTLPAFLLVLAGAVLRVLAPVVDPAALAWAAPLTAMLWVLGFAFFFAIHAPMLLRPRVDGKPG
ncbi:MAG: NnrS family protein [Pseudomonadota bacterium]